jgi:protein-arginine kinase activator protein McsA
MPSDSDLLFGKIALAQGFCSKEQIDWCVAIQATSKEHLPLGRILVNEGFLSEDQHSKVLTIQRKNLKIQDPLAKRDKESILFGKLAVREGLLTKEEANECLKIQGMDGEKRALGEIMVEKGYLTSAQVKALLAKQAKKLMNCPTCKLTFTVLTISQEKKIACPRCGKPLEEGKPSDSARSDAEFATETMRAAKRELPPGSLEASRIFRPEAAKVKLACVICQVDLEEFLDSTGRVRCPSCHSTFVPR